MNRFRGALLGLACGDAVGTTVEFSNRDEFEPLTDMVGGGPFNLKAGEWTDDTSMALCLAESLIEKNGMDLDDQLRKYSKWKCEGYLSRTCSSTYIKAMIFYANTSPVLLYSLIAHYYDFSIGNGSIMRLAPVPLFFAGDRLAAINESGRSSITTHSHPICQDACRLFGSIIFSALNADFCSKEEILFHQHNKPFSPLMQKIADGAYLDKTESQICGSGYVVESLEAALWCFYTTDNFRDAILKAANLGDDADTTAAICGKVAGAFYGEDGIPIEWRKKLAMHDFICELADKLRDHKGKQNE